MKAERLTGTPGIWGRRPTATSGLYRPRRPTFWILAVIFAVAAVLSTWQLWVTFSRPSAVFALTGLIIWVLWTLVSAWLVGLIDVYAHVPRTVRIAALAWGAFVTALISGPLVGLAGRLAEPAMGPYASAVSSPLAEEAAKYLGVALIAGTVPVVFRRPMGGLICGMLAGLGFTFFENWGFTNALVNEELGRAADGEKYGAIAAFVLERGFFGGVWGHLVFTGLSCMGIVYIAARRGRSRTTRILVAGAFFLGGVALHALNNFTVSIPGDARVPAYGAATLLQFAVLAWLIVYAIRAERRWLPAVTTDHVPGSVIGPDDVRRLRTRRSRRRVRAAAPDKRSAVRVRTLQRLRLGYAHAAADQAPTAEIDRLAEAVRSLDGVATDIPRQSPRTPTDTPTGRETHT